MVHQPYTTTINHFRNDSNKEKILEINKSCMQILSACLQKKYWCISSENKKQMKRRVIQKVTSIFMYISYAMSMSALAVKKGHNTR